MWNGNDQAMTLPITGRGDDVVAPTDAGAGWRCAGREPAPPRAAR
jgi:hypothetical protein